GPSRDRRRAASRSVRPRRAVIFIGDHQLASQGTRPAARWIDLDQRAAFRRTVVVPPVEWWLSGTVEWAQAGASPVQAVVDAQGPSGRRCHQAWDMVETATTHHPALRVLIVDDDAGVADMLRRYLEPQGFDVDIANDGAQARLAMQGRMFDLVLLDLGLPDGNGLSVMAELRLRWSGPVIIVSGHGE